MVRGVLQPKNSAEAGVTPATVAVKATAKTAAKARTPNPVFFAAMAEPSKRLPQWLTVAHFGNSVNRLVAARMRLGSSLVPAWEAPTSWA